MTKLHYHLLDVFTDQKFGGNQLAVFLDGHEVPENLMQTIARELNLSETVFVLPPEDKANHFKLRIFTPAQEVPIAGHPTVGTTYLLFHENKIQVGNSRLEEGVGVIPVHIDENGVVKMTQPLPQFGPVYDDRNAIAEMLSIHESGLHPDYPVEFVSAGVPFMYIVVKDLATLQQVRLRQDTWEKVLRDKHVFVFTTETVQPTSTVHARMFAPALGIPEDPATGAACGPLGGYLVKYGIVKTENARKIICEQGFEMGRPSLIQIEVEVEKGNISGVRIGGKSVYVGAGVIHL